jgi:UDP-N-acetylmuramate dehydrogenase
MNAGAYGGEMKEVVTRVRVVDENAEMRTLSLEDLQFGYRRSILQTQPWIVADVEMELRPEVHERVLARMSLNQYLRESKQPLQYPSAGSVFKRPPGKYVGPMVEQLGLKGYRIGGAQVSEKHAGFIINREGACAADVLALIQHVREQVQARFGVWLETEVRIIGEDALPREPR